MLDRHEANKTRRVVLQLQAACGKQDHFLLPRLDTDSAHHATIGVLRNVTMTGKNSHDLRITKVQRDALGYSRNPSQAGRFTVSSNVSDVMQLQPTRGDWASLPIVGTFSTCAWCQN